MRALPGVTLIAPLCYQGKADCMDPRCTRMVYPDEPHVRPGCIGYHCSYCDEPCSSQGHRCPAAVAMIEAAETVARERGVMPPKPVGGAAE